MQSTDNQHDKRIHSLIPENKVSNKSKNPAPDFEERIAFLRFERLERFRKVLLDRIYTYFTSMPGLIRLHYHNNITSQGRQDQARQPSTRGKTSQPYQQNRNKHQVRSEQAHQ